MKYFLLVLALLFPLQSNADSVDERRLDIQKMESAALYALYSAHAPAQRQIAEAYGYAVFADGTQAPGIAHNNRNGDKTYMQMLSPDTTLKNENPERSIFLFHTRDAFRDFTLNGLDLSDYILAGKNGNERKKEFARAQHVLPGVSVYLLKGQKLLTQGMLEGAKFCGDNGLNAYNETASAIN